MHFFFRLTERYNRVIFISYTACMLLTSLIPMKCRMLWVISGTAIFLSVVMESLQIVVPGRYPSSIDILLNIFGSAMGCLFLVYNQKRTQKQKKLNHKDTFNE